MPIYLETEFTNITIPGPGNKPGEWFSEIPDIKAEITAECGVWRIEGLIACGTDNQPVIIGRRHDAFPMLRDLFELYCMDAINEALDRAGAE